MIRLQQYAQYVDKVMAEEEAPGCESCTANRMMLEKVSPNRVFAWHAVATGLATALQHL